MDYSNELQSHKYSKIIIALASICINICMLALPVYTIQVYDRVITLQNTSTFWMLTIGLLVFISLEFAFRCGRSFIMQKTSALYKTRLHLNVQNILTDADETKSKKKLSIHDKINIFRNIDKVSDYYHNDYIVKQIDVLFIVILITVMLYISVVLACVICTILVVFSLLAYRINLKIILKQNKRNISESKKYDSIINSLKSFVAAKLYSVEKHVINKHLKFEYKNMNNTYELTHAIALIQCLSIFATQCCIISIVAFGAPMVVQSSLSLGTLIAGVIITGRFVNPIRSLLMIWFQNRSHDELFNEIKNIKKIKRGKSTKESKNIKDIFNVKNLLLPCHDKSTLNLRINENEIVSFCVKSAVKKAILRAALGISRKNSSKAYIDGKLSFNLNQEEIYKKICYINFSVYIISGTIKENITAGFTYNEECIYAICQRLNIHKSIEELKDGYNTFIDENSNNIPKDLKIAIVIARLLMHEPKLIIIDTETVLLDQKSKVLVENIIKQEKSKSAIILFTHEEFLTAKAHIKYSDKSGSLTLENNLIRKVV